MPTILGHNYLGFNADAATIDGNSNKPLYYAIGNSYFPFKNRIINGEFNVNQRTPGGIVNNIAGQNYGPDRWGMFGSAASKFSVQIVTDGPNFGTTDIRIQGPPTSAILFSQPVQRNFKNCIEIKSISAYTPGSNERFDFFQNIEGKHIADMDFGNSGTGNASGQTRYFILSYYMKVSITGDFSVRFEIPSANGTYRYVHSWTVTTTNTWVRYAVIVPVPTGGTWNNNLDTGVRVIWNLGAGSGLKAAALQQWLNQGSLASSTDTNLVGTTNATMRLTGIQLEYLGTVAFGKVFYPSDFQTRPWSQEIELCQRYYQKSWLYSVFPWAQTFDGMYIQANNSGSSTVQGYNHLRWPGGPMRATPTVTVYGYNSSTAGRGYVWNGSGGGLGDETATVANSTAQGTMLYVTTVSLGSHWMEGFHWTADAEPAS